MGFFSVKECIEALCGREHSNAYSIHYLPLENVSLRYEAVDWWHNTEEKMNRTSKKMIFVIDEGVVGFFFIDDHNFTYVTWSNFYSDISFFNTLS